MKKSVISRWQIQVNTLQEGTHTFTYNVLPESLELSAEKFEDIVVTVNLVYKPEQILVDFTVVCLAHLICDRTLEPFVEKLEGTYQLMFTVEDNLVNGEDVRLLSLSDKYINIADAVRDTILLAVPVKKIAPKARKKAIKVTFGETEETIDPRWEKLKDLRNKH